MTDWRKGYRGGHTHDQKMAQCKAFAIRLVP